MTSPTIALPTMPRALSPSEQLDELERVTGEIVDAETRARFLEAQPYKSGDLARMHLSGQIEMIPQGPRLLLCSIDPNDASALGLAGAIKGIAQEHDARKCIAHRIVSVGNGVRKHLDDKGIPNDMRDAIGKANTSLDYEIGARPMAGDHVFVLSTVADRASKTDRSVRLWTVHVDDVTLRWLMPS